MRYQSRQATGRFEGNRLADGADLAAEKWIAGLGLNRLFFTLAMSR